MTLTHKQKILELHSQGIAPTQIAKLIGCSVTHACEVVRHSKSHRSTTQRLQIIEDQIAECLVILRQLTKLPATEIERRIQQMEATDRSG